jgi:hypothetical protein
MSDKIEKIEAVSSSLKKADSVMAPNKAVFDALMQQKGGPVGALSGGEESPVNQSYLAELAKNYGNKFVIDPNTTVADLAERTQQSVEKIDKVKNELNTLVQKNPNAQIEIPNDQMTVLNKKLTHIDEDVKVAMSQVGVEFSPPGQPKGSLLKPIEGFLGRIANAQYEMTSLSQSLKDISNSGDAPSYGTMIALQAKMYQIQYSAETFSNMLNKLLDGFKTVLNVQV